MYNCVLVCAHARMHTHTDTHTYTHACCMHTCAYHTDKHTLRYVYTYISISYKYMHCFEIRQKGWEKTGRKCIRTRLHRLTCRLQPKDCWKGILIVRCSYLLLWRWCIQALNNQLTTWKITFDNFYMFTNVTVWVSDVSIYWSASQWAHYHSQVDLQAVKTGNRIARVLVVVTML